MNQMSEAMRGIIHDLKVTCPYCQGTATKVKGSTIYRNNPEFANNDYFQCKPCGAHIGTYPDGRPRGGLATAELRWHRREAHRVFDPFWIGEVNYTRTEAYAALADALHIPFADCHISEFDLETCKRVIEICTAKEGP
jgi:hypothetical protein